MGLLPPSSRFFLKLRPVPPSSFLMSFDFSVKWMTHRKGTYSRPEWGSHLNRIPRNHTTLFVKVGVWVKSTRWETSLNFVLTLPRFFNQKGTFWVWERSLVFYVLKWVRESFLRGEKHRIPVFGRRRNTILRLWTHERSFVCEGRLPKFVKLTWVSLRVVKSVNYSRVYRQSCWSVQLICGPEKSIDWTIKVFVFIF